MKFFSKGEGREKRKTSRAALPARQPKLMAGQEEYAFRRSRTLVGSLSNDIESAATKKPDLKSDRLKLHELHAHRRLVRASLISIMTLAVLVGGLIQNSILLAEKRYATHSDVPMAERQAYERAMEAYINAHPLQSFLVTLDAAKLATALQVKHPEIAAVGIQTGLSGAAGLDFHFRTPVAVWRIADKQFYVDENGIAFSNHYGAEPAIRVEDTSGYMPNDASRRAPVASKRFIGYLGQMLGAIRMQRVGSVERIVVPASARQIEVFLKGRKYPIKTHVDRDPYAQVEDVKRALTYFDKKGITPKYIDVRVEGKAFYK